MSVSLKYTLDDILAGKYPSYQTNKLKNRLLLEGIKENKCEECGLSDIWNGKKIILQLDHTNGQSNDHRLENLRLLCPNCHSQTNTFSGRNARRPERTKLQIKIDKSRQSGIVRRQQMIEERNKKLNIIENEPKTWGWVARVSKTLDISHTQVRRLYKKYGQII